MLARILDQEAIVFNGPGGNTPPLYRLFAGQEVTLGKVVKPGGVTWVEVIFPNGQRGYLYGETRIFHIKKATLLQNQVNAYAYPSYQAPVRAQYRRNALFTLQEVVENEGAKWVRVRDLAGNESFIEGQTKIRVEAEASKESGKKNMLYGGLWFIGGTVVTIGTMAAASNGGTYFVAYGAVIGGLIQFFRGLAEYAKSS